LRTAYLVDASPYIFRAHFSLPDSIRDRDGNPVPAVHGFGSFLLKLIGDERPSHLAITFDRSLTTSFRNELYPNYKADRPLPPPELVRQLEACEEMAHALGAAVFASERYEADDLIATLDQNLEREGVRTIVVTSDKDLAQLVSERVVLFDFAKGERFGPNEVAAKFGVPPTGIPHLLALAGDPVDNIPGVPGIGKKSAALLLARFGTVPALLERLGELATSDLRGAKALASKLDAGRDLALLSLELATVARNAPEAEAATADDLTYRGADLARLDPLCERLGFKGLKERAMKLSG
jgi:DNA polymerase I